MTPKQKPKHKSKPITHSICTRGGSLLATLRVWDALRFLESLLARTVNTYVLLASSTLEMNSNFPPRSVSTPSLWIFTWPGPLPKQPPFFAAGSLFSKWRRHDQSQYANTRRWIYLRDPQWCQCNGDMVRIYPRRHGLTVPGWKVYVMCQYLLRCKHMYLTGMASTFGRNNKHHINLQVRPTNYGRV